MAARGARVYFPELDGLRALAFALVLVSHLRSPAGLFWPGSLVDGLVTALNRFGWAGVDVFLVLSAHLIVTLLLAENDRTDDVCIGCFYVRRALRIWPLYYPYLLFAMLVYPLLQGIDATAAVERHLFPFLVFLGNYSYWYYAQQALYSFAHLWTICMEEQFYLLLPVLIYFGRRWSVGQIALALVGTELLTIACRVYVLGNGVPYPFVWSITACRLDPVVVGMMTAIVARSGRPIPGKIAMLAAAALFALVTMGGQFGSSMNAAWQLIAVDVAAGLLVLGATHARIGSVVFGNRPARFLGRISYGLYVYHEICLNLVWNWTAGWFPDHPARGWIVVLVLTLLADIAVSTVSYFAWERRFIVWKNRYEVVRSRAA